MPDVKIFVYDIHPMYNKALLRRKPWCEHEAFGTEIYVHDMLLKSPIRTLDPEEADLFYVPTYPTCIVYKNYANFKTYRYFIQRSIEVIRDSYPYFNRSGGADHIFPFVHDFGPCLSWDETSHNGVYFPEIANSIFITHVGDTALSCYSSGKDIVIPPYCSDSRIYLDGRGGSLTDPADRTTLVHFRGTVEWVHPFSIPSLGIVAGPDANYSHGVRQQLVKLYSEDPDFAIFSGESDSYIEEVKHSVFCLCPRGYAVWSRRLFDASMLGCIPVIIADGIELPFEEILDYSKFSVKILEADIPQLKSILQAISASKVAKMQHELTQIYNAFAYPSLPSRGDAMYHITSIMASRAKSLREHSSP